MNQITKFDLLIVYSERVATSANSLSGKVTMPFSKESGSECYNPVYEYFLRTCQRNNLKAAFTTSADIVGAGKCNSYWLFENDAWIKIQKQGSSKLIFDKFSPRDNALKAKRNLLFSSSRVRPFNSQHLFNVCFDKQKTYNKFRKFSIPTVTIENSTRKEVDKKCSELKEIIANHPKRNDFSNEIVMKDRFGAGGRNVFKFKDLETDMMIATIKKHKELSFIIQPFVKFDKGFSYNNSLISTDIRLIYLGKKIIQTYIRMAKKGNFICNEHKGGILKYISKKEVPSKVKEFSKRTVSISGKKFSLFALDYIISNNGNIYLIEANAGPGLDWNLSIKENEIEAKKLIRIIVKEIVRRIIISKNISQKKALIATVNIPVIGGYPVSVDRLTTIRTV